MSVGFFVTHEEFGCYQIRSDDHNGGSEKEGKDRDVRQ